MEMKAFSIVDEASGSKARISLFGATVISWQTSGKEHLFLSEKAVLDGSKAIRGGIPPVFPVFGKATSGPCADLPQHGFARNHLWRIVSNEAGTAVLSLKTEDLSTESQKAWPYKFELLYTIEARGTTLKTSLEIHNRDDKAFDFQTLLHTYFRVGDISHVHVEGLQGITYKDKVASCETKEEAAEVKCSSETDRVYPDVIRPVKIYENGKVAIEIERRGLDDIVLWNPWTGCSKMGDFGPADGYKNMVCVEAGAVSKWHSLESGKSHTAEQVFTARL